MAWMLADALGIDRRPVQGTAQTYGIFVRDLVLPCRIGIYDFEQRIPQRVRINVELLVERRRSGGDEFCDVLNYETIVNGIRALTESGHINLVETLAERILDLGLASPLALAARVAVDKLDIYPEAEGVGVVMRRRKRARSDD